MGAYSFFLVNNLNIELLNRITKIKFDNEKKQQMESKTIIVVMVTKICFLGSR